tara:strand:- start:262 stop:972 length:711 start_codon:yes stop_codon:yes gene_type:complete
MKMNRKTFPKCEAQKKLIKHSLDTRQYIEGKIPITGRSWINYSIQLFPDIEQKQLLKYMKNKDYLDIACGINHEYNKSLLNNISNTNQKKKHGLDIHTKNKQINSIKYFKGSIYNTKFPNNSYDCITINNFLYFWESNSKNLLNSYKELNRICKKGGEIRIFPVFFGNYYNDTIELFDFLNQHFSIQLLRPQKDYSNESPVYIEEGEIKQTDKRNGINEYKLNHELMAHCLVLRKL